MKTLTPIKVYCRPVNAGDGIPNIYWYLTKEDAQEDYSKDPHAYSEDSIQEVETFEGSQTHKDAASGSTEVGKF